MEHVCAKPVVCFVQERYIIAGSMPRCLLATALGQCIPSFEHMKAVRPGRNFKHRNQMIFFKNEKERRKLKFQDISEIGCNYKSGQLRR